MNQIVNSITNSMIYSSIKKMTNKNSSFILALQSVTHTIDSSIHSMFVFFLQSTCSLSSTRLPLTLIRKKIQSNSTCSTYRSIFKILISRE